MMYVMIFVSVAMMTLSCINMMGTMKTLLGPSHREQYTRHIHPAIKSLLRLKVFVQCVMENPTDMLDLILEHIQGGLKDSN